MKKIYRNLGYFIMIALLMGSCKKDDKKPVVTAGTFPASALTVSTNTPPLADSIKTDTVLRFSWGAAAFGDQVAVTYTLQLDVPSDTAGGTWANAKSFTAGTNIYTYGMAGQDLNTAALQLGASTSAAGTLVARIKADVNQNTGTASTIASTYSNTQVITVNAYSLILYVPGSFQGWNPATATVLNVVPDSSGKYEGYVYMPGTGAQSFKYTNAPDFLHINYGDGGGGTLTTDGTAAGMTVSDPGYYEVTANFKANPATWTATKTTWSVIGDATPGGWTTDTQMTYDSTNKVWTVTLNMITGGSFKFRANDAWVIDFGVDATGKLTYADNPFFAYNSTLNNLTVPSDGNYTITLDLHVSGNYTYTLLKH